ncbi:MAG: ATP-binding protein [Anaerolineaceae bacterium]|nr:ATP-binding protein [Anaerolineaceae bacterium]
MNEQDKIKATIQMTADEIQRNWFGEATEYDKKQFLEEKDPRSWLKSVSAFANGIGGSLIFGIADKTNEIIGLLNAEETAEKISRFIHDRMDPVPAFVLRFISVDGKNLVILNVSPGSETPYYYVGKNHCWKMRKLLCGTIPKNAGKSWKRSGSICRIIRNGQ